ncbi:MAG: toxin-antitoxin system TumE family protein [Beijerinckiaceae bacterium]
MEARLVIRDRRVFSDGAILEIVIWRVPLSVPPTIHGFKYRLFFGRKGLRIIGGDNERGKGDHRHVNGKEEPYLFKTVERLLEDFETEVVRERGGPI